MQEEMSRFLLILNRFHSMNIFQMIPELSRNEAVVLKAVDLCRKRPEKEGKVKVSDLVKTMQCQAPVISRSLGSLEKRGLICRETDTKDRRNTFVSLTAEGENFLRKSEAIMQDFIETVFQKMGREKFEAFMDDLEIFRQIVDSELERRKE